MTASDDGKRCRLKQLCAVHDDRRKWEAEEEGLSWHLDVALRKPGRAEEQMECVHYHKGSTLSESFDELSNPVVPSPEPNTVTTSQESP